MPDKFDNVCAGGLDMQVGTNDGRGVDLATQPYHQIIARHPAIGQRDDPLVCSPIGNDLAPIECDLFREQISRGKGQALDIGLQRCSAHHPVIPAQDAGMGGPPGVEGGRTEQAVGYIRRGPASRSASRLKAATSNGWPAAIHLYACPHLRRQRRSGV